jgi:hypothetical protein
VTARLTHFSFFKFIPNQFGLPTHHQLVRTQLFFF